MSLGVPAADNRNGVNHLTSLFSTLGKTQTSAGASGVNARAGNDPQYKGLDWASTLRQSTSQLDEQRSRPSAAVNKTTERAADRTAERATDRDTSSSKDRNADRTDRRTTADNDRPTRDVRRDEGANDASSIRDEHDVREDDEVENEVNASVNDDGASALAQDDAPLDESAFEEEDAADVADQDNASDEASEPATDVLTLALAGEQTAGAGVVSASTQQTPQLDAQTQAGQNQNQPQAAGEASLSQQPAKAEGATPLLAGQAQVEGKGDGKAALPAHAANAAHAQAQQNPGLNTGSPEQQSGAQQQNQQGQPQGHAGQQQAGSHASAAVPVAAAGQPHSAAALEIQTTATASNTQAGAAAGGSATHAGSTAAISLPAGADALQNAQGQDDTDPNVARIAQGIRAAVNLKGGAVTIRLNPHEMGHVRIEMEIKNGNISAQLQTEHASVRDLLNHQLGKLRETLQARGLHVERLEVNAPSQTDDSSAGRNAQESPNQGRSRGQFFQQRNGSDGQNGSGSQNHTLNREDLKSFGDMLVDMVG